MRTRRGTRTSSGFVARPARRWRPDVFTNGAFRSLGDRLLAIAFVLMALLILVGVSSGQTSASFVGTSTNPSNAPTPVQGPPPAGQNPPTSGAGGAVSLSWSATTPAPGTGHTLTYLVFRGPVGGPYTQIGSTSSLSYTDTPSSDGSYGY